ncbi:HNH endonuclease [Pseudomonas sp. CDFA 602]|uniref:HNH endonuclease n=1 Tax=Pseudomonas californiensis TaxID=2829823 RepID=UPI001E32A2AD|nr:HNH endonuclease signature motif containing protein [Pseudomonas californiensis]MCD5996495.1 HNH endonuclease [Pseudomonas californiensis]MCD6002094.1 HNH endonuclease [Pseudomonas californiensis]
MCEAHYYRQRRTGMTSLRTVTLSNTVKPTAELRVIPETLEHSHGYLLNYAPDHPLSRGNHPRVYQHRVVYYEHHGAGPFDCHWCQRPVTWETMHVDHVDDDKQNNDISNLVASCPSCNQARGRWKIRLYHRRQTGIKIGDRTHTINEWAAIAGISRNAIRLRLDKGWPAERAVFEPRGKFGPRSKMRA